MIDFDSEESHLLLNPRMPDADRAHFERLYEAAALPAHVFIASSGTTGAAKLVALSKRAILASAAAVNGRLSITSNDVLGGVLPVFHVGGLGIHARGHLAGARVVTMPWDPAAFIARCTAERITVVSLVPAQVHDLVRSSARAPECVRAILVGGGSFDPELSAKARALGWPVLAGYGMTECCSTVAVEAAPGALELLTHLDAREEEDGRLSFRGASLLTGYIINEGAPRFIDPKVAGWFTSEDLGSVEGRRLTVRGRRDDVVKIGGETVDLLRLERLLDSLVDRSAGDAAIVIVEDARLGLVVHLATTPGVKDVFDIFNSRVLPFERARQLHIVEAIPRSPLGKVLRSQLRTLVRGGLNP